jgi:hypothetical protein
VTWKGVPEDAVCRNRDDVMEMLGDSLMPCPDDRGHTTPKRGCAAPRPWS